MYSEKLSSLAPLPATLANGARKLVEQNLKLALDVADQAQMQEVVVAAQSQFGRLYVLVNNAGITRDNLLMRIRHGKNLDRYSNLFQSQDFVQDKGL